MFWLKNHLNKTFIKVLSSILRKRIKIGFREFIKNYHNINYRFVRDVSDILITDL